MVVPDKKFRIQGKNRVCNIELYLRNNLAVSELEEKFNIITCDGPYGSWPEYGWPDCDWDNFELDQKQGRLGFQTYYAELFVFCLAKLKDNGSLFIFNYPEGASLIKSVLDDNHDIPFRRWISWFYENHFDFDRGTNFRRSHETILYYGAESTFHGNVSDVLSFPTIKIEGNKFKDGAKPVEVIDYCIRSTAVRGGKLLSLFCGSGTDIVVALMNDMDAVGFEFNRTHFNMIVDRLKRNYDMEEV